MGTFSHLNSSAQAQMVDISQKSKSSRYAKVKGIVDMGQDFDEVLTLSMINEIRCVAFTAGVSAAKQTAQLIPLCHTISLDYVDIKIEWDPIRHQWHLESTAVSAAATGVEMEAFVACQVAALTIYDMVKAVCKEATMGPFRLEEKSGGKAYYKRDLD